MRPRNVHVSGPGEAYPAFGYDRECLPAPHGRQRRGFFRAKLQPGSASFPCKKEGGCTSACGKCVGPEGCPLLWTVAKFRTTLRLWLKPLFLEVRVSERWVQMDPFSWVCPLRGSPGKVQRCNRHLRCSPLVGEPSQTNCSVGPVARFRKDRVDFTPVGHGGSEP